MGKSDQHLTAARLRELLSYDPLTGAFVWTRPQARRLKPGASAGCRHSIKGYFYIKIDGRSFMAHRLAWLYVHGEWPADQVDHVDRNRANNRITNLRVVTGAENAHNRTPQTGGSSAYTGVSFHKRIGKWQSSIRAGDRLHHLGYFEREEDARDAYLAAKPLLHPITTYMQEAA